MADLAVKFCRDLMVQQECFLSGLMCRFKKFWPRFGAIYVGLSTLNWLVTVSLPSPPPKETPINPVVGQEPTSVDGSATIWTKDFNWIDQAGTNIY
jgi:hypothetical protein